MKYLFYYCTDFQRGDRAFNCVTIVKVSSVLYLVVYTISIKVDTMTVVSQNVTLLIFVHSYKIQICLTNSGFYSKCHWGIVFFILTITPRRGICEERTITLHLQIINLADTITSLPCVFFDVILGFPCAVFGVCVCVGITVRPEGQGGQAEEERPQRSGEHCV